MFKLIHQTYNQINKEKRKCFLNYTYILFKLLEPMGQTNIMKRVPFCERCFGSDSTT